MAKTRIYLVADILSDSDARLVEATSAAVAIKHCAKRYRASVPSTKEVVDLMHLGCQIELAGGSENLELKV